MTERVLMWAVLAILGGLGLIGLAAGPRDEREPRPEQDPEAAAERVRYARDRAADNTQGGGHG